MSRMSEFEKKSRRAMAMAVLDDVRMALKKGNLSRSGKDEELQVLRDAVEYYRSKKEGKFTANMAIFASRGLAKGPEVAVVPIYQALDKAIQLRNPEEGEKDLGLIEKIWESKNLEQEDRDKIGELITNAMRVIVAGRLTYS